MTERQDSAPGSPSQDAETASEPRFRSSQSVITRLSRQRLRSLAFWILISLGMLALVVAASNQVRDWMHGQPDYLTDLDDIELRPEPPEELVGGRGAILYRVRRAGKLDGALRRLDIDLETLAQAFVLHSPWVSRVKSIDRSIPGRLAIDVEFRRPVARVEIDRGRTLVVADDGARLPTEDIDPRVVERLPVLTGLANIAETRPGLFLGDDGHGKIDPRVTSALAMARILASGPGLSDPVAQIDLSIGPNQIVLRTRRGMLIHWRRPPGEETSGEPSASEKIAILEALSVFFRQEPPLSDPITRIDLTNGRDHLLVGTRRQVWVHWRHVPGEEQAGELSATEKLAAIQKWLRDHPNSIPNQGNYLEIDQGGARLHFNP